MNNGNNQKQLFTEDGIPVNFQNVFGICLLLMR